MITNGNYENIYEYDKDGNKTDTLLIPIENSKGEQFIPTKIFAQDGILRGVYKTNAWWNEKPNYTSEFFKNLFGEKMVSDDVYDVKEATLVDELKLICVREEDIDDRFKTGYINPDTGKSQGIGSGAGYIEVSNGTFEIITETP